MRGDAQTGLLQKDARPQVADPAATGSSAHDSGAASQKRSAALVSMLLACAMTALKLAAGLLTGSLGLLSDAAHSGLDLLGTGLTLFSVHISDKPADEDHTYGHAKVETLSAFTETFLMGASCVWILVEAIVRIFVAPVQVRLSRWPFAVLALSIMVDLGRARQLKKVAARSGSQALEADALHFASDIWSSAAVAVGLAASYAGVRYGVSWLRFADPVAALAVSAVILGSPGGGRAAPPMNCWTPRRWADGSASSAPWSGSMASARWSRCACAARATASSPISPLPFRASIRQNTSRRWCRRSPSR